MAKAEPGEERIRRIRRHRKRKKQNDTETDEVRCRTTQRQMKRGAFNRDEMTYIIK